MTRLNLAWNEIGSKGATYLAESLVRNTSLVHLDLSHNEIQDSGAERLACSLGGDPAALKVHGITGSVHVQFGKLSLVSCAIRKPLPSSCFLALSRALSLARSPALSKTQSFSISRSLSRSLSLSVALDRSRTFLLTRNV